MLGFWRKKKNPTFWHPRKLMLSYQALCLKDLKSYTIHDFLIPLQYPLSGLSSDWDAFRTFYCLLHLKTEGIKVKNIQLDKLYLGIPDIHNDYIKPKYLKLYNYFLERYVSNKSLSISSGMYLKYLHPGYLKESLIKDKQTIKYGDGDICFEPSVPFSVQAVSLALPSYLHFELEVNIKTLRKLLNGYITEFREDNLTDLEKNYFGFSFTKKVLRFLMDQLSFRQSKRAVLNFRSKPNNKGNIKDEFTEVFQKKYPEEYNLWQKTEYIFPFWETLLALEQKNVIEVHNLSSKMSSHCPSKSEANIRWHGFDRESLHLSLEFLIKPQETKESGTDIIEVIEVVKSDTDKFTVYLNENHLQPLFFSKKTKLGHLLYRVAEDGYVRYYKTMEKTLEYAKDSRCKLFAKTQYKPMQLFEIDEDGYVMISFNLVIRILQKEMQK